MRTGNPDILKSEAKRCGSHYFEPSTMRFFASRLSPNLHPSEKGEDVTYFVTSEQHKSSRFGNDPRRYSVHRFKNCKIDTVGEFQAFKTSGAAHTAAKRFARGVTSDGLSGFLPASGAGKLALVGGAAAASFAIYYFWHQRAAAAPKTPAQASSEPAVISRVTPRAFEHDLPMLLNLAARIAINRPQDRRDEKTEADVRKTMSDIARENGMPNTAEAALRAGPGFMGWSAIELWPGTPFSVYYYIQQHVAGATGQSFDQSIMPVIPGTVPGTSRPIHGAPIAVYDDGPAYAVMH